MRPTRMPDVVFAGRMPDTGHAEPQWLIQRGGAYLQTSEVLYRIAEAADGRRDLDEIALIVSAASRRAVSAADVQGLIEAKLVPARVITGAVGAAPPPPQSPLGVGLRMRMLGPRVITPIARALGVLYVPAVAIAVVITTVGTRLLVYRSEAVTDAALGLVQQPLVMPVLLGLIALGAAFHELGHAAALARAGGVPRAMGVGLYLIYPVFFTDVTDSYRLSRWRRITVDLGGFYFNLIFALFVFAAYLATHQPVLLVAIALTDAQILHQAVPFGRLDGYWVLADLAGVPDPLSAFVPSLRRLAGRADGAPRLRASVMAAVLVYAALFIPALIFFVVALVQLLPRVVSAALGSFLLRTNDFEAARVASDLGSGIAAVASALVLLLPVLAIVFVLLSFARWGTRLFMNVSGRTRVERTIAAASGLAALALLIAAWMPIALAGGTSRAEEKFTTFVRAISEPDVETPSPAATLIRALITLPPATARPSTAPTPPASPPRSVAPAAPATSSRPSSPAASQGATATPAPSATTAPPPSLTAAPATTVPATAAPTTTAPAPSTSTSPVSPSPSGAVSPSASASPIATGGLP